MTRRRERGLWLGVALLAAAAALLLRVVELPAGASSSLCLLRRATGVPCPGCGLTRALAALARGEWAAAVALHPLAPLVAAQVAALWALWGWRLWRPRPLAGAGRWRLEALALANVAALLALWVGRMAAGTLPF